MVYRPPHIPAARDDQQAQELEELLRKMEERRNEESPRRKCVRELLMKALHHGATGYCPVAEYQWMIAKNDEKLKKAFFAALVIVIDLFQTDGYKTGHKTGIYLSSKSRLMKVPSPKQGNLGDTKQQ